MVRRTISLNENWQFYKGCSDYQVQNFFQAVPVDVPHTWNAKDGQDGNNDYWRGTSCYRKIFQRPECLADK